MNRLIVISDDRNIRETLATLHKESDWQIRFLSEGQDSWGLLKAVSDESCDLMVVDDDLIRPESDKFIRSIKKINDYAGIIFLTSDASVELGQKISQLGVQFYCIKPVVKKDLMQSIESISRSQKRKIY